MQWRELRQIQDERRKLRELEQQLQCSGAMPGTRMHDVLQEHKRRVEQRYRRALRQASEAGPAAELRPRGGRTAW